MIKFRLIYLYLLTVSLIPVTTCIAADEGAHAAEFLSHGVGARALGMGSAFVAIADDATAPNLSLIHISEPTRPY